MKLFLVGIVLLILLASRFLFFYQNQPKYHDGQKVSFQTTLLKEPQNFSRYQRFSANLNPIQEVFITTSVFSQLHYGDTLRITGTLKERVLNNNKSSTFFSRSNDSHKKKNEANSSSKQRGIEKVLDKTIMTMLYPKIGVIKDNKNLFLTASGFIREKATLLFQNSLPPTSASLLLGIVFGIKETMPQDFRDSLRVSGVFHVVAASGMNVTLVGGFLSSLFGIFLKRQIAIMASILGIGLYAVIAGFDPPIIRASVMGILVFTGQLIGRQSLSIYGLFLSGSMMLFFSPDLIFDIGFQLSFLATFGLLYIRPILEHKGNFKKLIEKSIIGEGIVTTVAAQTATLPILLANFGTYSLWSIVVNGLVLWTIPPLMVVGGIAALFGIVLPQLGQLILYLSLPFLLYFEKTIVFFGKAGGIVGLEKFSWQIGVGYYFFLVAFIIYFSRKK